MKLNLSYTFELIHLMYYFNFSRIYKKATKVSMSFKNIPSIWQFTLNLKFRHVLKNSLF